MENRFANAIESRCNVPRPRNMYQTALLVVKKGPDGENKKEPEQAGGNQKKKKALTLSSSWRGVCVCVSV